MVFLEKCDDLWEKLLDSDNEFICEHVPQFLREKPRMLALPLAVAFVAYWIVTMPIILVAYMVLLLAIIIGRAVEENRSCRRWLGATVGDTMFLILEILTIICWRSIMVVILFVLCRIVECAEPFRVVLGIQEAKRGT